jgi:hypothetical protein
MKKEVEQASFNIKLRVSLGVTQSINEFSKRSLIYPQDYM